MAGGFYQQSLCLGAGLGNGGVEANFAVREGEDYSVVQSGISSTGGGRTICLKRGRLS